MTRVFPKKFSKKKLSSFFVVTKQSIPGKTEKHTVAFFQNFRYNAIIKSIAKFVFLALFAKKNK